MSYIFKNKDGKVLFDTANGGGANLSLIGYQSFVGNNLYNKEEHYHTGYVSANGQMASTTAGGYVDVPVEAGKMYMVWRLDNAPLGYGDFHFKDAEGNNVGNLSWTPSAYVGKAYVNDKFCTWVIAPENATSMYFTVKISGYDASENLIIYSSGVFPSEEYLTYNPILEPLRNKTWFAVGDSITEMNTRTENSRGGYVDKVQKATGVIAYNYGISGTGWKRMGNFYNRVDNLPSNIDYVTIYGSINDVYGSGDSDIDNTLGNVTDTIEGGQTSLCAYFNGTIDKVISKCPNAKFGVILPIPAKEYGNGIELTPRTPNNKLMKYADKLKEVCERRGVPCLDLYRQSNLHPENEAFLNAFYTSTKNGLDEGGIHPTEAGHELFYKRVVEFLKSL